MKIIAFGHRSRYGKDSAASMLKTICKINGLDAKKIAFADKLKMCCYIMFAWAGHAHPTYYDEHPEARNQKLVPLDLTPIELWVKFGTTMVRHELHDLTWVNAGLHDAQNCDVLIISDLRFPNEVAAIKSFGGHVIKVDRPGYPKLDTVADNALEDFQGWDDTISATNLSELNIEVERIYNLWLRG
jgi:hypothetical protein